MTNVPVPSSTPPGGTAAASSTGIVPANAGRILASLIIVAAVANLNLSVANVALPSIGLAFDASQTQLNLVAVGYSLGLAASVLWLGALGDRYGRKMMLLLGIGLSIPACLAAAFAPTVEVLILARIVGGVSAGMAYPTTLALITALWGPGPGPNPLDRPVVGAGRCDRGARAARVGVPAGALRVGLRVPRDAAARSRRPVHGVAERAGPRQRDRRHGRQPRRHPLRGPRRLADPLDQLRAGPEHGDARHRPCPGRRSRPRSGSSSASAGPRNPLYDLDIAARPTFWVAALAGIIVFGSLMGAMFIGQQYLQNVLGYSTLAAGRLDPAGCRVDGDRGPAVGEDRRGRGARASRCSSATCSSCWASSRCSCSGRRAARTPSSVSGTDSLASVSGSPARRRPGP